MSEISKLLKDCQNPQARLMAETRGLVSKWEKTGLLEGITTDTEKSGMSILLENQAKQNQQEKHYQKELHPRQLNQQNHQSKFYQKAMNLPTDLRNLLVLFN